MATLELVLPPVSEDQRVMMDHPARILWIGAGTKTGKTVALALLTSRFMAQHARKQLAWVGPWYGRARTGYEHVRNALGALIRAGYGRANDSTLSLALANGSRLSCYSGDRPDSIYGAAFDLVVVDEATRMKEAVFPAIRSTVTATGGQIRFAFNTDRQRKHWAIREFLRARAGEEDSYGYVTLPTSRSPYVKPEDIEQARRTLPSRVFRALYDAEIMDDDASVFRGLDACIQGEPQPAGPALHAEPYRPGRHYVMGVDLARLQNWTVISVLDDRSGRLVYHERFHGLPWAIQRERIKAVWKEYGRCRVIPDASGVGDAVVEEMVRGGIPCEPFVFTGRDRTRLIENLIAAVEQRELSLPDIEPLVLEMEAFEYQENAFGAPRYGAAENAHDDCVMSLGLATWGLRGARRVTSDDVRGVRYARPDYQGVQL